MGSVRPSERHRFNSRHLRLHRHHVVVRQLPVDPLLALQRPPVLRAGVQVVPEDKDEVGADGRVLVKVAVAKKARGDVRIDDAAAELQIREIPGDVLHPQPSKPLATRKQPRRGIERLVSPGDVHCETPDALTESLGDDPLADDVVVETRGGEDQVAYLVPGYRVLTVQPGADL